MLDTLEKKASDISIFLPDTPLPQSDANADVPPNALRHDELQDEQITTLPGNFTHSTSDWTTERCRLYDTLYDQLAYWMEHKIEPADLGDLWEKSTGLGSLYRFVVPEEEIYDPNTDDFYTDYRIDEDHEIWNYPEKLKCFLHACDTFVKDQEDEIEEMVQKKRDEINASLWPGLYGKKKKRNGKRKKK